MFSITKSTASCQQLQARNVQPVLLVPSMSTARLRHKTGTYTAASRSGRSTCLSDVIAEQLPDPFLRAAIKEPLAFWGGLFAGALQLNLNEDPLRDWVQRTSQAARQGTVDDDAKRQ